MTTKPATKSTIAKTIATKPAAPKPPIEAVEDAPRKEKAKKEPKPRRPVGERLARSIDRLAKRAKRMLPMYEGTDVHDSLKSALISLQGASDDAHALPFDWKPEKTAAARAPREPIAVGTKVRIAKGVLKAFVSLLADEESEEALNDLTVVKFSEKHSVVRTPGGTRFAIGTRMLRRA